MISTAWRIVPYLLLDTPWATLQVHGPALLASADRALVAAVAEVAALIPGTSLPPEGWPRGSGNTATL